MSVEEGGFPTFQGRAGSGRGGGGIGLRFRGGPGKGVAEEAMEAGRRAAAEGR